jgi:hypothetical protein
MGLMMALHPVQRKLCYGFLSRLTAFLMDILWSPSQKHQSFILILESTQKIK